MPFLTARVGVGLLKLFHTKNEVQQEVASLRSSLSEPPQASQSYQNLPYEYEIEPAPGLPDEIYAITLNEK